MVLLTCMGLAWLISNGSGSFFVKTACHVCQPLAIVINNTKDNIVEPYTTTKQNQNHKLLQCNSLSPVFYFNLVFLYIKVIYYLII